MSEQSKSWDAELYDGKHAYVYAYGAEVVNLLAPQSGERILDLGCGTGHLTNAIAQSGADAFGLDSSANMIAKARVAYPNLHFDVADARDFKVEPQVDAVFSNAVLHWVLEPERAVTGIADALKPGGRFVAEFGGRGNVDRIVSAVRAVLDEMGTPPSVGRGWWFFPGIAEYSHLLEKAGLEVVYAALIDRPTLLEDGEDGFRNWLKMFAEHAISEVPEDLREDFYSRIESRLRVQLHHDGAWHADYRRIRVKAVKQGSIE